MTRLWPIIALLVILMVPPAQPGAQAGETSLGGRLLVASPKMRDPRFGQTVIILTRHRAPDSDPPGPAKTPAGAMGFIVNKVIAKGQASDLLATFGITLDKTALDPSVTVYYGGPVQANQGFVLHSNDFSGQATHRINAEMSITMSRDVMQAIAQGTGPKRYRILIGYAGWGPNQLESEIGRGDWDHIPATTEMIFGPDDAGKWDRARESIGVAL